MITIYAVVDGNQRTRQQWRQTFQILAQHPFWATLRQSAQSIAEQPQITVKGTNKRKIILSFALRDDLRVQFRDYIWQVLGIDSWRNPADDIAQAFNIIAQNAGLTGNAAITFDVIAFDSDRKTAKQAIRQWLIENAAEIYD